MSQAQILEFGSDLRFGNLSFPDLENRFEKHLERVKTITDLDNLIRSVGPLFKDKHYSYEELIRLKKLRQRAYDRRRNPKFQMIRSKIISEPTPKIRIAKPSDPSMQKKAPLKLAIAKESVSSKPLPDVGVSMSTQICEQTAIEKPKIGSFSQGVLRGISHINGEHFIKTMPKMLAWFMASALVSFFLWQQSLALYETAGFTNSIYSAAGGILMIVGFAAYYSITRSWLALFFCMYAVAYEGYLMVSGTIHNENHTHASVVENNPELVFLQEKANKERVGYHELKQRYDNPESKVFKNDWFLKNHLNPAWEASAKAHEELVAKKALLLAASKVEHVTWLKILYRLGLVFLCMMLVHSFFACCV
jgi:hypothetical protein